MFLRRIRICNICGVRSRFTQYRLVSSIPIHNEAPSQDETKLSKLIQLHQKKIIYNSFIFKEYPHLTYKKNYMVWRKLHLAERERTEALASVEPLPFTLRYTQGFVDVENESAQPEAPVEEVPEVVHFPYRTNIELKESGSTNISDPNITEENTAKVSYDEVKARQEFSKHQQTTNWMVEYENYEDPEDENLSTSGVYYGTPNPESAISNIPCGGCGALLHCKEITLPGYIPSEIYKNCFKREGLHLNSLVCQRCHFLKNYDIALQVRVSHNDYRKVLETIKDKYALIILMVDLLDFPCSIWPGMVDVVGSRKPIIVVGNKIDLLPRDSRAYLDRIKERLRESVLNTISSNSKANIKHVGLISAKTGWGVEELINKLHNLWGYRGDVYLVGSTNVGKSTLFNCLIQSDYCKIQAVDLVQRATTSIWPGTTMNLLKFPILRPSGWRLYVRTKRLQSLKKIADSENQLNKLQLKKTNDPKYATLVGRIDKTFSVHRDPDEVGDPFSMTASANSVGKTQLGINETDIDYVASKWCYDTPGVVQETQIIHLLTTEELMLTLPKTLIEPQSLNIRLGQTLFIAGIGRVDFIAGPPVVKLTVFCADTLPVTVCYTEDAELLYAEFLGTDVFQVPKGSDERLKQWPALKTTDSLKFIGNSDGGSCGDIVLSNGGWVAVQCDPKCEVVFNAWTPEGRGIYGRKSLLPYSVKLRSTKLRGTPVRLHDKIYVPQ